MTSQWAVTWTVPTVSDRTAMELLLQRSGRGGRPGAGEDLEGPVDVGLAVVQVRRRPQPAAPEGHVDLGGGQPLEQRPVALGLVVAEDDQGRPPRLLPGADQPVAVRVETVEEPLDQLLVPGRDPLDAKTEQVLDFEAVHGPKVRKLAVPNTSQRAAPTWSRSR